MWRFVQISDPHLGSQTDGEWNNRFLYSMMPDVIRCLKRDLAGLQPDFILATGDLSSQQTRDAMFAARDLMDSLGFPYYHLGGNHDFLNAKTRSWFLEAFHAHLEKHGIPHEAAIFDGSHDWNSWKPVLERVLRVQLADDASGPSPARIPDRSEGQTR